MGLSCRTTNKENKISDFYICKIEENQSQINQSNLLIVTCVLSTFPEYS